jgi:hypothetical protein
MSMDFFDSAANIIGFVSSVLALVAVIRVVISYRDHLPRAAYGRLQSALHDVEDLLHEAPEIGRPLSPGLQVEYVVFCSV